MAFRFAWGFDGIRRFIADEGYQFFEDHEEYHNDFETRRDIGLAIEGKIKNNDMLS